MINIILKLATTFICILVFLFCCQSCFEINSPIKRKIYPDSNLDLNKLIHTAAKGNEQASETLNFEFSQGCPVSYLEQLARLSQDKTISKKERRTSLEYIKYALTNNKQGHLDWACVGKLQLVSAILAPEKVLPEENLDLLHAIWVKMATKSGWAAIMNDPTAKIPMDLDEASNDINLLAGTSWSKGDYDFSLIKQLNKDQIKASSGSFQYEIAARFKSRTLVQKLIDACQTETNKDGKMLLLAGLAATRTDLAYRELNRLREVEQDKAIIAFIDTLFTEYYLHNGILFGHTPHFFYSSLTLERAHPESQAALRKIFANYFGESPPVDLDQFEVWWHEKWDKIDVADFVAATIELASENDEILQRIGYSNLLITNKFLINKSIHRAYSTLYQSANPYAKVAAARILCTMGDFRGIPYLIDTACGQPGTELYPQAEGLALRTLVDIADDNFFRDHDAWTAWWKKNAEHIKAIHKPSWIIN